MTRKHSYLSPSDCSETKRDIAEKNANRLLNANSAVKQFVLFAVLLLPVIVRAFPAAADVMDYDPFNGKGERYDYIIYCMLATAVIETLFFFLCGYKDRRTLMYVFFINLLSNLILNLPVYPLQWDTFTRWWMIAAYESVVIVFEFILLGIRTGWKLKIFSLLILSNLLSYGLGELYYRLVYFD